MAEFIAKPAPPDRRLSYPVLSDGEASVVVNVDVDVVVDDVRRDDSVLGPALLQPGTRIGEKQVSVLLFRWGCPFR